MSDFNECDLAPADRWDDSKSNPRDDMKRGAMAMGASEREAEIFIECLMGKRKYDIDLHFDLNSGKLRRSLEEIRKKIGDRHVL